MGTPTNQVPREMHKKGPYMYLRIRERAHSPIKLKRAGYVYLVVYMYIGVQTTKLVISGTRLKPPPKLV